MKNHCYVFESKGNYFAFDTCFFYVIKISESQKTLLKKLIEMDENEFYNTTIYDEGLKYCIKNGLFFSQIVPQKEIREANAFSISFTPTHTCNLRCKYCFADHGENYKQEQKKLTKEIIVASLNYFKKHIEKHNSMLRIDLVGGGENFLNPEAISLINKCAKEIYKDVKIWICTNGTVFNDKVKNIVQEKNVSVGISLDGNKTVNDTNRLNNENESVYEEVIKNVGNFSKESQNNSNLRNLWGLVVVTKDSKSLHQILEHHKTVGFASVQMKLVRKKEYGKDEVAKIISLYNQFAKDLVNDIKNEDVTYLKMIINDNDYFGKIIKRLILNQRVVRRCSAGRSKFSIDAAGNIYPCDPFVGYKEFILGNVYDEECTVFDSEFYTLSKEKRVPCNKCWAIDICGGDCLHNSWIGERNIRINQSSFCVIQKQLIEFALVVFYELGQMENEFKKVYHFV